MATINLTKVKLISSQEHTRKLKMFALLDQIVAQHEEFWQRRAWQVSSLLATPGLFDEREHVVGSAVMYLRGNGAVRAHGGDAHDGSLQQ